MLNRLGVRTVAFASLAIAAAGCYHQADRLHAPPQGVTTRPSPMQDHFVYMTDNAALADASVADIHFEPRLADLNGLGVRKLTRLGELMSVGGGAIHYETIETDKQLVDARLEAVRTFLKTTGYDANKITVTRGLPQSATMPADDAVQSRYAASGKQNEQKEIGNKGAQAQNK
jgi:hypothetical protein